MAKVFLSYNSRDRQQVRGIVQELTDRGISVLWDQTHLAPGRMWITELENICLRDSDAAAIVVGPHGYGPWQYKEASILIDRHSREPDFPVIPVKLPKGEPGLGFLNLFTWVDLSRNLADKDALDLLAAACLRQDPGELLNRRSAVTRASVLPFRGMQQFREEDEAFFFGRDAFTEKLSDLLKQKNLVGVVGPSGSGKSSVVHAGLLPRLRREDWEIATLVPSDRPLRNLAGALLTMLKPDLEGINFVREVNELTKEFQEKTVAPRDAIEEVRRIRGDAPLILVVDQCEELFTLSLNPDERDLFISGLIDSVESLPLKVVFTLRADFYASALANRRLADHMDQGIVNLGPMTHDEMRESIERPAAKVGLSFDHGLVELILQDIANEPGALPLLEFLLSTLWLRRDGELLSRGVYNEIGGVKGVIANVAEEAWATLNESQKEDARRIVLRLVQSREGTLSTRRRAAFSEFRPEYLPVIKKLANSRILVTARDPVTGEEILDLAHEALISRWERLADWLRTDQEFLIWRQRLEFACDQWRRTNRDPSLLLIGPPLEEARKWDTSRPEYLSKIENDFIGESLARDEKSKEAAALESDTLHELADSNLLLSIQSRSDSLWPALPDSIGDLEKLQSDVIALLDKLPAKTELLNRIESKIASEPSPLLQWQHDSLLNLTNQLADLRDARPGLMASIHYRLAFALSVRAQTIDAHIRDWLQTINGIQNSRLYKGLKITPQIGLIPLGPDPDSGFFEFLHFQTHDGPIPGRNQSGHIELSENLGIILVLLPGGEFLMGAQRLEPGQPNYDPRAEADERPVHPLTLSPLFVAKYLMTQRQWSHFTGSNPSRYKPGSDDDAKVFSLLHPVEDVTWHQCNQVLTQLGLVIPTEAQWEYAARAGTQSVTGTEDDEASIRRVAHLSGSPLWDKHAPVGSYAPNGFGLFDTIGNVWEWTRDWHCSYTFSARPGDGLRGTEGRFIALRGMSFFNSPAQVRIAWRTNDAGPDRKAAWLGIRPARGLDVNAESPNRTEAH